MISHQQSMKSMSHLKIQHRNFPFPLQSITSVPQWCTLCWSDSSNLSLLRLQSSPLLGKTNKHTILLHTHTCSWVYSSEVFFFFFFAFSHPIERIQYFSVLCHTRQADSSSFKLVRRQQVAFSYGSPTEQSLPFRQLLSSRATCQKAPLGTDSSDNKANLPGVRTLLH